MIKTYEYAGLTLEYDEWGSGPVLLFLHGLGGNSQQICPMLPQGLEYRVIAPHLQGHGNSQMDSCHLSFNRMAEDVKALLEMLEIKALTIVGISMGAGLAISLAMRLKCHIKEMILIRPAWTHEGMPLEVKAAYQELGEALAIQDIKSFYQSKTFERLSHESHYSQGAFIKPFEDYNALKNWERYRVMPDQKPFESTEDLKGLKMPIKVIVCHNDFAHPYALGTYYQGYLPSSELIEIPDKDTDSTGHVQMIKDVILEVMRHAMR